LRAVHQPTAHHRVGFDGGIGITFLFQTGSAVPRFGRPTRKRVETRRALSVEGARFDLQRCARRTVRVPRNNQFIPGQRLDARRQPYDIVAPLGSLKGVKTIEAPQLRAGRGADRRGTTRKQKPIRHSECGDQKAAAMHGAGL
jgi:hypothetical protein